jgi:hypothetical protein
MGKFVMRNALRSFHVLAFAAALLPTALLAQAPATQAPLEIVGAYWGFGNNFADVTAQVRSMVRGDDLNMPVNTATFGVDPFRGDGKLLRIYYRRNGQFYHREWRDGAVAQIGLGKAGRGRDGFSPTPTALHITFAVYGMGAQVMDVTGLLQTRIANNRVDLPINNASLGGDPAPQVAKQFRINYEYGGVPYEITLNENDVLHLPDAGMAPAMAAPPVAAIRIVRAEYGSGPRQADVSGLMQTLVGNGSRGMIVNNTSLGGGDPDPGQSKTLHITYEANGQRMEKRVNEGQQLILP